MNEELKKGLQETRLEIHTWGLRQDGTKCRVDGFVYIRPGHKKGHIVLSNARCNNDHNK